MRFTILCLLFLSNGTAQYDLYNKANFPVQRDSIGLPLPVKAMFKSLIIPGWGQLQNKDPWWKPVLFAGVETLGWVSSNRYSNRAEDIRRDFESYGDIHWEIERWYTQTKTIFPDMWENIIIGTHKMGLKINGDYYHTDELTDLLVYHSWSEISVIRDRDFYENIGKYDQFVGGWDDAYDDPFDTVGNWWTVQKGSVESIILTKQKDYYRDLRHRSNLLKHYSRYAVSVVMFNHIVSGMEAAWTANKKDKHLPGFHLNYDPRNKWGVGGVGITFTW
ncbi:MAG: hypothetical protein ISR82_02325 [Candidatus Marinimicrobia bacterium]|nr:hypothetical protein [Candidatus Neomarinimicrobiota bacterium]MBL7010043.1 hypothetical protein [Candidatus Neomarinimicrobiota bacterium]MBL7030312.1 hypothetical protein [Candidatus Neomarinimicrobiota bacterium]